MVFLQSLPDLKKGDKIKPASVQMVNGILHDYKVAGYLAVLLQRYLILDVLSNVRMIWIFPLMQILLILVLVMLVTVISIINPLKRIKSRGVSEVVTGLLALGFWIILIV